MLFTPRIWKNIGRELFPRKYAPGIIVAMLLAAMPLWMLGTSGNLVLDHFLPPFFLGSEIGWVNFCEKIGLAWIAFVVVWFHVGLFCPGINWRTRSTDVISIDGPSPPSAAV